MRNQSPGGLLGLAGLLVFAFSATPTSALTINTSSSTLSVARGCGSPSCFFSEIYTLSGAPAVSGSFDISGTTLTFSIDLVAATLIGSDGAVTAVNFTNVNYSGSVTVVDQGSFFSITDQSATVAGTLTPVGAGSAVAFNLFPVNLSGGICSGTPGSSLSCGMTFGAGIGFEIDVNGNPRYFNHTVNLFSIPEPNAALLLGLGLSGLAASRRRSIRVAN